MKMNKNCNFHFPRLLAVALCLGASVFLSGCVGQIEDTKKDTTVSDRKNPGSVVSFQGIDAVVPISNSKVEVYFYQATGGSGKYSYQVYVGDDPTPRSGIEDTLERDYLGRFRMMITGLSQGTE